MTEEWRAVVGYEGRYEVSSHGRVKSLARLKDGRDARLPEKILKPIRYTSGHLGVTLYRDQVQWRVAIHRLVCWAFHGPPPSEFHEVRHLDDVKANNSVNNLVWGTRQDNIHDALRNGVHYQASQIECRKGHAFTPENTWNRNDGTRECYACRLARKRKYNNKFKKAA